MELKCMLFPIFKATEEPQSSAQALGSSSDARRHHGSQPCPLALRGRGAPSPPFPHRTPRVSMCNVPCPPFPSCKCAFGFFVFYSQSIAPPGLAGSLRPAGDSPQCLCS